MPQHLAVSKEHQALEYAACLVVVVVVVVVVIRVRPIRCELAPSPTPVDDAGDAEHATECGENDRRPEHYVHQWTEKFNHCNRNK